MIIEYTGAPACGKTTIVNNLCSKKYDLSYKYKINFIGKLIFHCYLMFPFVLKDYKEVSKNLKVKNIYKKNIYTKKYDINMIIKFLGYVCYLYKRFYYKKETYYLDEGIIHYLVALEAEYNVPHEECVKFLAKQMKKYSIKCFYVNINEKKCFENFKIRNRKQTSIDYLDNNNIFNLIKKYNIIIKTYIDDFKINEII